MSIDIIHGLGYRIGEFERIIGDPTNDPIGFTVLNQQTGNIFISDGAVWTNGGIFPNSNFTQAQFDEWILC